MRDQPEESFQRGAARMVVCQYLPDMIDRVGTEDQLVEAFMAYAEQHLGRQLVSLVPGFRVAVAMWRAARAAREDVTITEVGGA